MTGIAVVVGAVTVIGGRYYIERGNQKPQAAAAAAPAAPAIAMSTVVVAAQPLRFGMELSSAQLKEVQWPANAVPPGATTTVAEFLKGPEKRMVITAMEPNEPVLAPKVTGPGQRATLSAILAPGMTAVTVTLSESQGVTGLALPGDRVNVMLTRTTDKDQSYTDVLLQNVKLLAIDQVMDQRAERPLAIRNATLEVMPQDAKRLALAGTVGSLSLMLRKAGEESAGAFGKVGVKDLLSETSEADTTASHGRRSTTVKVTRNGKTDEYTVLTDKNR
ncbi:MAG: Flp pilus assembly protein CpaB [Beijerinckiaceae bacterium]